MTSVQTLCLVLLLFVSGCNTSENTIKSEASSGTIEITLPEIPERKLQPMARIEARMINESSGLIQSRVRENTLWTHNDSGDEAKIYALDSRGNLIKPTNTKNYRGILIAKAINRDWEDITQDDQGHLIIGACGNNDNTRRDLSFYIFNEPNPLTTTQVPNCRRIPFHYPDQTEFPPAEKNFDCEAIFWANGKLYLLTKHRSDTFTKLYRLDSQHETESNPLTYLSRIDVRDQVTGADASADGKQLVVLTYSGVWLFEKPAANDDYLRGKISWLPISARQCEAICFFGENLIIGNEQRELFKIPLSQLVKVN